MKYGSVALETMKYKIKELGKDIKQLNGSYFLLNNKDSQYAKDILHWITITEKMLEFLNNELFEMEEANRKSEII